MRRICVQLQVKPDRLVEDLGENAPDTGFLILDEIFNLEDQLTTARNTDPTGQN